MTYKIEMRVSTYGGYYKDRVWKQLKAIPKFDSRGIYPEEFNTLDEATEAMQMQQNFDNLTGKTYRIIDENGKEISRIGFETHVP